MRPLTYISLCSGIEAASVAWLPLGWKPICFAEIDPFASLVLQKHYSDVPNVGDITKLDGTPFKDTVDVLIAGTPCQDFSTLGSKHGLAGEKSGLAYHFIRLVQEIKPKWFVWENVPGAFSTNQRRDFYTFIKALEECGYSLAWRVLNARHFGVAQQRRRIFLVGHLGDWQAPTEVLFESEDLQRYVTETEEKQCSVHYTHDEDSGVPSKARCLTASGTRFDLKTETFILEPEYKIRRLTPVEYERLQGFPDNYTLLLNTRYADASRYKALGNSIAVPILSWLGKRIQDVSEKYGYI